MEGVPAYVDHPLRPSSKPGFVSSRFGAQVGGGVYEGIISTKDMSSK